MKVLNFGSLNIDYVYQVESILIPGETQASKDRQIFCGGKGLNQSIALAKAGIPVYHAGMIGDGGKSIRGRSFPPRGNRIHITASGSTGQVRTDKNICLFLRNKLM